MINNVLIIPGYQGSGAAHWQTWLESRLPGARRVRGIDWQHPDLSVWSDRVHETLQNEQSPVWLVAHSFGALVAAVVAAERPQSVAGVVFVAPADPRRFSAYGGVRRSDDPESAFLPGADAVLPEKLPHSVRSVLIASENDPWLRFDDAVAMASRWNSHFINMGGVGHINTQSGFGPWPALLEVLRSWTRQSDPDFTLLPSRSAIPDSPRWASWRPIKFAF